MTYRFDFAFLADAWPLLLDGVWLTLAMSGLATLFGFILGTACAIGETYGPRPIVLAKHIYVEAVRNTPLLVQIFLIYFGLASIGLRIPAFATAVLALSVNIGAYTSEIIRAGIESIAPGQIEAADCLGLTRWQVILHVVLTPAIARIYPALTSQFVLLMLASSLTSQISAEELTGLGNLIQAQTFRSFEVYLVVAACYIVLAMLVRLMLGGIGRLAFPRLGHSR
jgi:polar amino acid transport system permease protein